MPLTTENAAAWNQAIQSMSQATQVMAQSKYNKKAMKWNEKQIAQSRQWALDDYNRMNEYNSPAAQMERLKAAGLNPNLVYGNGATTQASPIKQSDAGVGSAGKPETPNYAALGNALSTYQDTQLKNQQLENMKTQRAVMQNDIEVKRKVAEKYGIDIDNSRFDLDLKNSLRPTTEALQKTRLERAEQEIQIAWDQNAREWQKQTPTLEKMAADIQQTLANTKRTDQDTKNMQQNLENAIRDGKLKDFEIKLNQDNVTKSDPLYFRLARDFFRKVLTSGE